ncbi:MAG TPA: hypothetical protein VG937_02240 [Polyangiaceae bacterium]|nr:hypothetical protein [Polyangiaceae bacterium]
MARARNYSGWARELDTLEYFRSSLGAELYDRLRAVKLEDTEILKHLREPVAVRPNRFNRRLQAQAGTFTLHGGKIYGRTERAVPIPHGDALPAPVHLQDLEQKPGARPFLRSFVIAKTRIRKQLAMLGIHRGTLFPELDGQAAFLKARWRHE